jgi:hypothetical protein
MKLRVGSKRDESLSMKKLTSFNAVSNSWLVPLKFPGDVGELILNLRISCGMDLLAVLSN